MLSRRFKTPIGILSILAAVAVCPAVAGCRSEGESRAQELMQPMQQAVQVLAAPGPQGKSPQQAALELLESNAVSARQTESKLDDVVKTLNPGQKKALADRLRQQVEEANRTLDQQRQPQ